jgi:hypothetical protein
VFMFVNYSMNVCMVLSYVHAFISTQRRCLETMSMIQFRIKRQCFEVTTLMMVKFGEYV